MKQLIIEVLCSEMSCALLMSDGLFLVIIIVVVIYYYKKKMNTVANFESGNLSILLQNVKYRANSGSCWQLVDDDVG